jgi:RNase H-fold protein (predicted Holliday junction resolvase)
LYNKDNRQLDRTKKFVEKLKNIFKDIKIETVDERFTSFEEDNIL